MLPRLHASLLVCVFCTRLLGSVDQLAVDTRFETGIHVVEGTEPGPTVLVIGGIHGNEPAGSEAARAIANWTIQRGRIIVVPRANEPALMANKRYTPGAEEDERNLNRNFPKNEEDTARGDMAPHLWTLITDIQPDWVLDLHEGFDFHEVNPESVGSSIIACDDPEVRAMAERMLLTVDGLRSPEAPSFSSLENPVAGSLVRSSCDRFDVKGMILETTTKDQPVAIRARQHRHMVHRLLDELGMEPSNPDTFLPARTEQDPVRIAIYSGPGTGTSAFFRFIHPSEEFRVFRIGPGEIHAGGLSQFDVLVVPGGSGSRQARGLGPDGREQIRVFIRDGGGYLGSCAGAYLAAANYDWSLGIIDAAVIDRKHWRRGSASIPIELSAEGIELFEVVGSNYDVRYVNGPILVPAEEPGIPDYRTLATYRGEVADHGAPTGIMPGTAAIAVGEFGEGRVLVFSPHVESKSTDPKLRNGIFRLLHWLDEKPLEGLPEADAVQTERKKR